MSPRKQTPRSHPVPRRPSWPKHLRGSILVTYLLVKYANELRSLYGVPIYLVGSALRKRNPRDWDIRIRLSKEEFRLRFGMGEDQWNHERSGAQWSREMWRYSDECVKRSRVGLRATKLNIDFQIYPPHVWRGYNGKPRLRLDTRGRVR